MIDWRVGLLDEGLPAFECQMEARPPQPPSEKGRKMRPFGCDICQKMFTRVEILRRHLKTHMDDKVCDHDLTTL